MNTLEMNKEIKTSKYGSIIPTDNFLVDKLESLDQRIAFSLGNNTILKGRLLRKFDVKNFEKCYGIEIDNYFSFCIESNSTLSNKLDFNSGGKFMIIVDASVKYLEIDCDGFVINSKNFMDKPNEKYKPSDIVLFKLFDVYKAATIIRSGNINSIHCHEIEIGEDVRKIVLDMDVIGKLLDNNGFVNDSITELHLESVNNMTEHDIEGYFRCGNHEGILKWQGTVNGLECVGICNDKDELSDFSNFINVNQSYFTMIPYDRERDLPLNQDAHYQENLVNNQATSKTARSNKSSVSSDSHRNSTDVNADLNGTNFNDGYVRPLSKMSKHFNFNFESNDLTHSIYAIVNSMFIFSEMFDSLILKQESQFNAYLVSSIVFPLRREKYVEPSIWEKISNLLDKQIKHDNHFKKILRQIGFTFKMFDIATETEKDAKILDLYHFINTTKSTKLKINELLNLYCIKNSLFIKKPQKCIILGLSGDKKSDTKISISLKLDITKLTVACSNCCSVCSSEAECICNECSEDKMDVTYFCRDHKTHCKHVKNTMNSAVVDTNWKGKVELELYSIICKNGQKCHTYVKSNDVKGNWIRFSIDEENISSTEIDLQSYFTQSDWDKQPKNTFDAENLEKHVTMCFYKYPPLEYYWGGF